MTLISGDVSLFAKISLEGFCRIHADSMRRLPDGVVRRNRSKRPKVALVVGGGAGHYPAFLGYVGAGMADAAVTGDVFASPSAQAIIRTVRAAHYGHGVILGYGNYAGDVLNFGIAAERLNAEGIETRLLPVSDDIASAPASNHLERRGIAGDLSVFKIVGAAAESGLGLQEVFDIGQRANAMTRTLGIALSGCTLPGAEAPLFSVSEGQMAVGLGVHGEPGLHNIPIPSVEALATLFCDTLYAEKPANGKKRLAVILNGLGATKYEELYNLWVHIDRRLKDQSLQAVAPCVGEYMTSLDMAGCSLTMTWLDETLEPLWCAPVACPALTRTEIIAASVDESVELKAVPVVAPKQTSPAGRRAGECVANALSAVAQALMRAEAFLGKIDAQTGDGDHGQGMARGSAAAADAARQTSKAGGGPATVLAVAADAWADRAGGTSGALWGAGLHAVSLALDDAAMITGATLTDGVNRAREAVMRLGGAKPGDKTLVDALCPFADALIAAAKMHRSMADAWHDGAKKAQLAAAKTKALQAKRGRSRTHAEKSVGHPDAGALSLALVVETIADLLKQAAQHPAHSNETSTLN